MMVSLPSNYFIQHFLLLEFICYLYEQRRSIIDDKTIKLMKNREETRSAPVNVAHIH